MLGLVAMAIPANSEVITELPEGLVASVYSRTATATRPWGEGAVSSWTESSLSDIAIAENGDVYMKNAVGNFTQGYIKGHLDDGVINVSLPQQILFYDAEVDVTLLNFDEENATYTEKSGNVSFTVDGDCIRLSGEGTVLGMVNGDKEWTGYALEDIIYTRNTQELVNVPEDAEFFDIAFSFTDDQPLPVIPTFARLLQGARKDDKIYIQGLADFIPEAWVMGTVFDDKIEFQSGQLLGSAYEMAYYFCTGIDEPEYIPGYDEWEHHYSFATSLSMKMSADGIWAVSDPNETMIINANPNEYSYGVILRNPTIKQQPKDISQVPATPTFIKNENICKEGFGAQLTFNVSPYNVDGYLLDTKNLAFVVYVKGEPYTFEADKYWLEEDITEVPWGFDGGYIACYINGYSDVDFPEDERIYDMTVRVVNHAADGNDYWSGVLDPFNPDASISVTAVAEEPVRVIWFDLSGRPVSEDAYGCLIKHSIMPDGTIRSEKIIR